MIDPGQIQGRSRVDPRRIQGRSRRSTQCRSSCEFKLFCGTGESPALESEDHAFEQAIDGRAGEARCRERNLEVCWRCQVISNSLIRMNISNPSIHGRSVVDPGLIQGRSWAQSSVQSRVCPVSIQDRSTVGPRSIQGRSKVDPVSIQDHSWIDPRSLQDRSRIGHGSIPDTPTVVPASIQGRSKIVSIQDKSRIAPYPGSVQDLSLRSLVPIQEGYVNSLVGSRMKVMLKGAADAVASQRGALRLRGDTT